MADQPDPPHHGRYHRHRRRTSACPAGLRDRPATRGDVGGTVTGFGGARPASNSPGYPRAAQRILRSLVQRLGPDNARSGAAGPNWTDNQPSCWRRPRVGVGYYRLEDPISSTHPMLRTAGGGSTGRRAFCCAATSTTWRRRHRRLRVIDYKTGKAPPTRRRWRSLRRCFR